MGNLTAKRKISWSVTIDEGEDVTILSENKFTVPALSDMEELTVRNFEATGGTYVYLFPITGRGQLYIEHSYKGEFDMPMELRDYLRV